MDSAEGERVAHFDDSVQAIMFADRHQRVGKINTSRRFHDQTRAFTLPQHRHVVADHPLHFVQREIDHLFAAQRSGDTAGDFGERGKLLRPLRHVFLKAHPLSNVVYQHHHTAHAIGGKQRIQVEILHHRDHVVADVLAEKFLRRSGFQHFPCCVFQHFLQVGAIGENVLPNRVVAPSEMTAHEVVDREDAQFAIQYQNTLLDRLEDRLVEQPQVDRLIEQPRVLNGDGAQIGNTLEQ